MTGISSRKEGNMKKKAWKIVSSDYLIKNKWLTVRKDHVRLPSGVEMDDYYVLEYPNWVSVIAITEEGKYVMELQYRHGTQMTGYELCGGTVEEGEDFLETAKRELLEETGYSGGKWELLTVSAPNPAAMTNLCYTYVAQGVKKTREQELEKTEDIDVLELTEQQVFEILRSGQIYQGDMLAPLWQWFYSRK